MPGIDIRKIRNVALLSHGGSGKTSLAEALLFSTKAITRMGTVENGNTVSDYEPEEIKRVSSTQTSLITCMTNGCKINLLDTPGYEDFRGEVVSALRVTEGAIILVSAVASVEVGTEQSWTMCEERNIPRILFINKVDRENSDISRTLDGISTAFGRKCVPLQIPVVEEQGVSQTINCLDVSADVPESLKADVEAARERLVEAVAETDDDLATKYLESGELTQTEINEGLKKAFLSGEVVPILMGSATQNQGSEALLNAITSYLPSPLEGKKIEGTSPGTEERQEIEQKDDSSLVSLVFKTSADPFVGKLSLFRVYSGTFKGGGEVWNANREQSERIGQLYFLQGKTQETTTDVGPGDIGAVAKLAVTTTNDTLGERNNPVILEPIVFPTGYYTMSVSPKSAADIDKMSSSLSRIMEEDPTLKLSRESATSETLISSLGNVHIDTTIDKVKRKFGTELLLQLPKVPYRETITTTTRAEYKHKKQSGGHGQYGHAVLRLEPTARDAGFSFASEVVGGSVPREYIPSVEKGVTKALNEGSIAGYPVVDVKVVLFDGSYHDVDSSGNSFEIAGSFAFRKGMSEAKPILLEPIVKLSVKVPDNFTGDVIGDINGKRGQITGMIPEAGTTIIEADVPHAEVLRYSTELRSMTQGRASYTMEFSRYEGVPPDVSLKVLETAQRAKEEE